MKINACVQGTCMALAEVKDETFRAEILGKGVAILPSADVIYSPVDGQITTVFKTKHAIGILSKDGVEILIHVGIDTVELNGIYFECLVEDGAKVKQGDLLLRCEMDRISETHDTTTMMIITNSDDYESIEAVLEKQNVEIQDVVIKVDEAEPEKKSWLQKILKI